MIIQLYPSKLKVNILFLFLFIFSCQKPQTNKQPLAQNGIINLKQWNFDKKPSLPLNGKWKFYWQQFLSPQNLTKGKESHYITVPGNWNEKKIGLQTIGGNGFATYALQIQLNSHAQNLALQLGTIGTAYKLYINKKLVAKVGQPAMEAKNAQPGFYPKTIFLQDHPKQINLLLQVSNYHHRRGGIWYPIILGKSEYLVEKYQDDLRMDWFLVGSILIIGIYHISLFLFKKNDLSPLWFGLYSFSISLLCITVESDYLYQLISNSWTLVNKIEYLSYYVSSPLLALFIQSLYPDFVDRKKINIILWIAAVFCLLILFSPPYVYSYTVHIYEFFNILVYFYLFYCLLTAVFKRKEGSYIFIFGYSILYATVINDILYSQNIIYTEYFLLWGLTFFIFSQSIFLSMRFSNLFNKVEFLSQKIEQSNQKLIKTDKLKDEFLANTSHELKTPLHGIIGISESLIDGTSGKLSRNLEKSIMNIVFSSKRLYNLVNDILDFSKIQNQDLYLEPKPVDIRSLGQIVIALMKPLIGIQPIKIFNRVKRNFVLGLADENRLQQVLLNLIGNAIKFTHEGEIILSAEQKEKWIYITVSDTGIGIAKEKQELIFKPFQQGDGSISREYGGMGIGLSITKKLIELHGGEITVDSVLNEGSKFIFTIPVAENENMWVPEDSTLKSLYQTSSGQFADERNPLILTGTSIKKIRQFNSGKIRNILIVDDEPINIEVVKQRIHSLNNVEIRVALNGFQALEEVQILKPDLILLDIMMPRMSGYDVCSKLREKYQPNEMAIILLTARSETDDLVEGFNRGANDYITKPFTKSELLSRINTHLNILELNTNLIEINRATSRFFPDDYLGFLHLKSIREVNLGDHISKEMAVMFSDIRSFTNLSESMTPQENFDFVNKYLQKVSPVIRSNNGIIVKYLGDGMMALFSGSVEDGIRAGLEKLQKLREFNNETGKNIRIGIGLNYGHMMMGLVGEENRMQGDAFSDNVNLAARVESLTRHYGVSFIVTDSVIQQLEAPDDYIYRFLDRVKVKGKDNPVNLYEIIE